MASVSLFRRLFGSEQVVREGFVALLYRDGRYQETLPPGRHRITGREAVTLVVTLPQTLTVGLQEVTSIDGFQPRLSAVASYVVADPHLAATCRLGGYQDALLLDIQMALRLLAASHPAEDLVRTVRDALDTGLLGAVQAPAREYGLEVTAVRLRDVILPADLRRLLTGVEKARREGQAALERAHAEHASLRALANAARMLRNNPELQNLRLLQAVGEGKTASIVLGAPGGLLPLPPGDTGGE